MSFSCFLQGSSMAVSGKKEVDGKRLSGFAREKAIT